MSQDTFHTRIIPTSLCLFLTEKGQAFAEERRTNRQQKEQEKPADEDRAGTGRTRLHRRLRDG